MPKSRQIRTASAISQTSQQAAGGARASARAMPTQLSVVPIGDSKTIGVGAVLRAEASSESHAVERARALADQFFDGAYLMWGANPDLGITGEESIRIYLAGAPIQRTDIVDVEALANAR